MIKSPFQPMIAPGRGDSGRVTVSLSEIESMSRKATRGAGYTWGLAEESGYAIRWLSSNGFDGITMLLDLLRKVEGNIASHLPIIKNGSLTCCADVMCPICSGAAISDRSSQLTKTNNFRLKNVFQPMIVVPFVANVAKNLSLPVICRIDELKFVIGDDGLICGNSDNEVKVEYAEVEISLMSRFRGNPSAPSTRGISVNRSRWQSLDAFSHRTHVPSSETSRTRGAGAHRTD